MVAKHLGIARETVHRWIDARDLLARRIGRLRRFRVIQVDARVVADGANEGPAADKARAGGED